MDFTTTALKLLAILGLIAANGFFVAAEFALVSVRPTRIDQLVDEGSRLARIIQRARANPTRFLLAAQIGITIASLALGWIAEPTLASLIIQVLHGQLDPHVVHALATALTFTVITFLHIVLGENVPKAIALQRTEPTVLFTALPMEWLARLCTPFIKALEWSGDWFLKAAGLPTGTGHGASYTPEEIQRILTESGRAGLLEAQQQAMLQHILSFTDKQASDVMVPRPDIEAFPADLTGPELLKALGAFRHTRYPIYRGDVHNIVGVLHTKDVFAYLAEHPLATLRPSLLARAVPFVPESAALADLLSRFRQGDAQCAVVMDEFGGTIGFVTLGGLVAEVVGAIADEFGAEDCQVEPLGPGRYRVDGAYRVDEFNARFGTHFDEEQFLTIAGWVFGRLGRTPHVDDHVEAGGLQITVERIEGMRITSLLIRGRSDVKTVPRPPS